MSETTTELLHPEFTQTQIRPRLIPVTKWNQYHDWPPKGGLRHLIFHAPTNGFAKAFKRVGRRVLIDESEFFKCVDRQNSRAV